MRQRYAVQWPQRVAARPRPIGGLGRAQGPVGIEFQETRRGLNTLTLTTSPGGEALVDRIAFRAAEDRP